MKPSEAGNETRNGASGAVREFKLVIGRKIHQSQVACGLAVGGLGALVPRRVLQLYSVILFGLDGLTD